MRPITEDIADLVETTPGWTPPDQLLTLYLIAMATAPLGGDIIEIGSWCGRSTAVLALAAQRSGVGRVHAIDLFPAASDWRQNADGTHSFTASIGQAQVDAYTVQTVWDEPYQRDIAPIYARYGGVREAFDDTLRRTGVADIVTPFRGTGAMFAERAPKNLRCRLAFIDGDHSFEAVCADIDAVEQFLLPGGWITFDDAFSSYEGVNAAITKRIVENPAYADGFQATRKCFVARRLR